MKHLVKCRRFVLELVETNAWTEESRLENLQKFAIVVLIRTRVAASNIRFDILELCFIPN